MKDLRTKITATYLILALTIVIGVSAVLSWTAESFIEERLVQDIGRQAEWVLLTLKRDSTLTLAEHDRHIREIASIENLRITLINDEGSVLYDSEIPIDKLQTVENHLNRPEVQQSLVRSLGWNVRQSATVGHDFLYVAKRVPLPPRLDSFRSVKFVRLSMPFEDVQDRITRMRINIFVAGFLVLIVVLGVSIVVSRRISNPMVSIAQAVERIRAGNLDEHIPVTSHDEIGQVARAINELVDKLKADIVQLRKLEKVRSEFLGNVSHELRTPIFAIQGFIETLLNGAVDDPSVNRSFLEKAQSHSHRLDALLKDLIDISHIESGEMKMSFRYFRLNEFLENIGKDFHHVAEQKKIRLNLSLATQEGTEVFGDKERLGQVLSNLIDNALKYNRAAGEVTVAASEEEGKIRLSVTDTGVGIAQEHLPRIFERFYRVDKDRSRELGGTGLGLAIVKHIVEAHKSSVTVESSEGVGSVFSFTLRTN